MTRATFLYYLSHADTFIVTLITLAFKVKFAHLTRELLIDPKIRISLASVEFSVAEFAVATFLQMYKELVV